MGTKLLKLQPYKATVVHSLLPPDYEVRIQFCRWFQDLVFNGFFGTELTFYSDKVWFTLSAYVSRITGAGTQKHHAVCEVPLHDLKVGVWRAIIACRTIGPIFFFHGTVNFKHYARLILPPFLDR
jgi:hypothetical protein